MGAFLGGAGEGADGACYRFCSGAAGGDYEVDGAGAGRWNLPSCVGYADNGGAPVPAGDGRCLC